MDNELVAYGIGLVNDLLNLGVGLELEIAAWHLDGLLDEGLLDGAELVVHHVLLGLLCLLVLASRVGTRGDVGNDGEACAPVEYIVCDVNVVCQSSVRDELFHDIEIGRLIEAQLVAVFEEVAVLDGAVLAQLCRGTGLLHAAQFFKSCRLAARVDMLPG